MHKITQGYRSRCSTETHQIRPESLKIFRMVQQGEVSLLRVVRVADFENNDSRFLFVLRRISQPQPSKQASQE